TTTESHMEVGGKRVPVHPIAEDLSESALLEGVDLVFFATPGSVTRQHAPQVAETGLATIDIGGALAGQATLSVPAVDTESLEDFMETRLISSPSGPSVILSQVLGPLVRMGATSCRGTALLSAGLVGRAGVEELSQQVIALFSGGEPPRTIFPTGLAFDLNAQVGPLSEGWTIVEQRLALETGTIVHLSPLQIAMTAVMVPLFAGVGLSLYIEMDQVDLEGVAHFLGESSALRLGDPVPGPRRLAGRPQVHVGRLRVDPRQQGIHLFASADNLRAGATANVLQIARHLWEDGLL
ncbi:MAG: aspartate-semialdehyde dehydrogenase, partial [Myxococcota bacterium]